MLELLTSPEAWASLVTLTVMEIVLGIDNIIFISLSVAKLSPRQGAKIRKIGLALALIMRILLLVGLTWLIGLTKPILTIFSHDISWRDLVLIGGGLFLLVKATLELHAEIEGDEGEGKSYVETIFLWAIVQIVIIDLVFSVDSIITAIGMAKHIEIMIAAVLIAMAVMYMASGAIAQFISRYPTTKILALAFLLLIGVALIADGLGLHIPRGYIYFAMAFAVGVEIINIMVKRKRERAL